MADDDLDDAQRADLAALADGSLPPERRAEVEARVAASPALRARLDAQRAALAEIRAADEDVASERLRAAVRTQATTRSGRWASDRPRAGLRRRPAVLAGLATACAAAAAVVVIAVAGGDGDPPAGVERAAQVAAGAPAGPAPGRADDRQLAVESDGIAFPDWEPRLGWAATGTRRGEIEGREAVTVYYERDGERVGYAIVARPALELPGNEGRFRRLTVDGRRAIAWHRAGRTCVVAGDLRWSELMRLARSVRYY